MNTPRRLPAAFSTSAAYPLFAIDPATDRGWVMEFEPDDYRRASFLDRRSLRAQMGGWEVTRAELETTLQARAARPAVNWLFHIGHCGSTLASRLLDLLPGVLGVREPLPLLALAQVGARSPWLQPTVQLLARGFADTRAVVVKPTSVVGTIAEPLLEATAGHACLLWVDLSTWLATMLRDEALFASALATETLRVASMPSNPLPEATTAAERMSRLWLMEQLRWQRLTADPRFASRLLDLDFADMLANPVSALARLALHYRIDVPQDLMQDIDDSQLLTRYAKDDRQAFDADTRYRELAAAQVRHQADIDAGIAWAERALADGSLCSSRLRPRDGSG
jgi:hypothetical protein